MSTKTGLARAVIVLAATCAAGDAIGTAFSPYLLTEHPFVLLALCPDDRHITLLAGSVRFDLLLVFSLPRRMLAMFAAYGFGVYFGRPAIGWAEKRWRWIARFARFTERALDRVGAPLLVLMPGYTLSLLSGVNRRRFSMFAIATAIGQVIQIGVLYLFGDVISAWTAALLAFLSDNVIAATAMCVALVLVQQIVSRLRKRASARSAIRDGL